MGIGSTMGGGLGGYRLTSSSSSSVRGKLTELASDPRDGLLLSESSLFLCVLVFFSAGGFRLTTI